MRRPVQSIPRPHSADFLEYETRMEQANNTPEIMRAPRPKSSLDINRTPDNFYYSEASYAEKMRQSALYLQKTPNSLYSKDKHSDVIKQSNSRGKHKKKRFTDLIYKWFQLNRRYKWSQYGL